MRNMNSIIYTYNRSILSSPKTNYGCNCGDKTNSSLQNQCLTPNIFSQAQADVSNNMENEKRIYLGVSETPFKERYSNHVKDIAKQLNCENCMETKAKQQSSNNNMENCEKSFWKSQAYFLQIRFNREIIDNQISRSRRMIS